MSKAAGASPFDFVLLLNRKGGATEMTNADEWTPDRGLLWIDLELTNEAARKWVQRRSGLDEMSATALLAKETRPRSLAREDALLVVLRGVNMNPGNDREDMVALRMWIEPDRVITSRRRDLLSVTDVREALLAGSGPISAGGMLVSIVARLAERIGMVVNDIEEQLDSLEIQLSESAVQPMRAQLSDKRREIAEIRRHLGPQRDALDRLYRQQSALLSEAEIQQLREESDRVTRYLEDLDLAREHALVAQEELATRMALEQNARMYVLSIVAAIFLPLSFLTGLFGMNVAGLPGTANATAFAWVVGGMLACAVALLGVFRWKKWF